MWAFFVISAIFGTACVFLCPLDSFAAREFATVANVMIVEIGLLLFSVSAVTSLADERVRGSLDVLLTTPLRSRSVVWGKWWGTYRTVPLLALLPMINVFRANINSWLPMNKGDVSGLLVLLALGLVLAYGAVLTSLGLALATWIERQGRAAAWNATGFVLMTIGPIIAAQIAFEQPKRYPWVASASPFFGVGALTEVAGEYAGRRGEELIAPAATWIFAYFVLAGLILLATLASFDFCLGRVRQRWRGQSAA